MALEQVLSDRDSEDEVDDDIADLEDRRVSWKNYFNFPFSHLLYQIESFDTALVYDTKLQFAVVMPWDLLAFA